MLTKLCIIFGFGYIFIYKHLLAFNVEYDPNSEQKHYVNYQPEQIHLAFGDNINYNLSVTWTTFDDPLETIVQYGQSANDLLFTTFGTANLFIDGGSEQRGQYIHRVYLKNLLPDTTYVYRCGSNSGWSNEFNFHTTPATTDWGPRFVIYGDLGNINGFSLPLLQKYAQSGFMNGVIHIGDFGYNWQDDNGRLGDVFMRQIEPIAAYVPYMTAVGNHESAYHYRERFTMPGHTENFYYSFNQGPVHFIVISTEHYFFKKLTTPRVQYEWLINDLIQAQNERHLRPWIVLLGHRPYYCVDSGNKRCKFFSKNNTMFDTPVEYPIEPLIQEFNVDLGIWAHLHAYVRFWPLYNQHVQNGSFNAPYTNPKGTVHIVTGAPGNYNPIKYLPKLEITAYQTMDPGFTVLQAFNKTHLKLEQISAIEGIVQDSVWIIINKQMKIPTWSIDISFQ